MLGRQGLGGLEQVVERQAPLGVEAAVLGRCEGKVLESEVGELGEHSARALEALRQRRGSRAKRRGAATRRAHHVQRLLDELAALALAVGAVPRGHESQALVDLEAVALRRVGDELLAVLGQRAQRQRQRWPDLALVDAVVQRRREPCRQRQALAHPMLLAAAQLGDRGDTHAVLGADRVDDPRLVHRRQRARRRVARQQELLRLGGRAGTLDDHRHRLLTAVPPTAQPLEAVDDLQPAALQPHCPDRQLAQGWLARRSTRGGPAAQRRQRGQELVGRDPHDLRADGGAGMRRGSV